MQGNRVLLPASLIVLRGMHDCLYDCRRGCVTFVPACLPACVAARLQELRAKLEDGRQEVEKLEGQLREVGDQHSKELQNQEEKVGASQHLRGAWGWRVLVIY